MTTARLRALVSMVITLFLAASAVVGTSASELAAFPRTTQPLSAVDLSAIPAGWVPVAYGDAQISVPAGFNVYYLDSECGSILRPGTVLVGDGSVSNCSVGTTQPNGTLVHFHPLTRNAAAWKNEKPRRLNGLSVYLGPGMDPYLAGYGLEYEANDYIVPSLGIEVAGVGPLAKQVLSTLTRSPRAVVLASGPVPAVQYGWHTLTFDGLSFTAPGWWQVTSTFYNYGIGTPCTSLPGASFFNEGVGGGEVVLSTDRFLAAFPCPIESGTPGPVYPGGGIEVDAGSNTLSELATEGLHPAFSRHCPDLHGLTACPASSPAYSILGLKVRVPGRATPVFVSIGLAGNGMVARTILYSLRRA